MCWIGNGISCKDYWLLPQSKWQQLASAVATLRMLATRTYLQQCGLHKDTRYSICGTEQEDIIHAMRDCMWIKHIWSKLVPVQHWNHFFQDRCYESGGFQPWQKQGRVWYTDLDWRMIFQVECRLAWKIRNKIVYDEEFKH